MILQKRANVFSLLCLLLLLSISNLGFCADAPPLPTDITIVPPGPNVPEDLARMSGKWVGTCSVQARGYSDTAQHILIVEKIDELGFITVIYARGNYPLLRNYAPAFWARYKASWGAETKELMVSYPYDNQYATIFYKLTADGRLVAKGHIGNEDRQYSLRRE